MTFCLMIIVLRAPDYISYHLYYAPIIYMYISIVLPYVINDAPIYNDVIIYAISFHVRHTAHMSEPISVHLRCSEFQWIC